MERIAKSVLKLGHVDIILPSLVLLILFGKRTSAAISACFVFFELVFNTVLKHTFKVPLFPHLGKGYGFPSGHMHAVCVFYGSLFFEFRNPWIRIAFATMVLLEGFALYICRYHDVLGIAGAVGFGVGELVVFQWLARRQTLKFISILVVLLSISSMIILQYIHKIESHVWLGFYAMCGLLVSVWAIREVVIQTLFMKAIAAAVSYGLVQLELYLFRRLKLADPMIRELRFFFLCVIVIGATHLTGRISLWLFRGE
jgi:undecaprenyl-diphosphatase